jgi:hypothetical protein
MEVGRRPRRARAAGVERRGGHAGPRLGLRQRDRGPARRRLRFGAGRFDSLVVWDHSPIAADVRPRRRRQEFPGLDVAMATPGYLGADEPIGLLVLAIVLNELSPGALEEVRRLARDRGRDLDRARHPRDEPRAGRSATSCRVAPRSSPRAPTAIPARSLLPAMRGIGATISQRRPRPSLRTPTG